MNLYELGEQYKELSSIFENSEELEESEIEAFENTLESIADEGEKKIENLGLFYLNLQSNYEAIRNAREKMAKREVSIKKRIEWLKQYLLLQMNKFNFKNLQYDNFEVSIRKNPPKVIIADESIIPVEYKNIKTIETFNLENLKNDLKEGQEIPGVNLSTSYRVQFK